MSGGYFDYKQWQLLDMADEIDKVVSKGGIGDDEWFTAFAPNTLTKFSEASRLLKEAGAYVQRIDWLLSGDDGEDCFHERLAADLEDLL